MWHLDKRYKFATMNPALVAQNRAAFDVLSQMPLDRNVWLTGKPGTGKTHMAKCAGNRHHVAGQRVELMRGPHIRTMSEMWARDREESLGNLYAPELLIIDDLDKCVMTAKALEVFWSLMDVRYLWHRRTIITSNIDAKALMQMWMKVKDVNPTLVTAGLDRMNPCHQFTLQASESLRRTIVNPARLLEQVEPVTPVSPDEAETIREAFRSGNLRLLANMRAAG